MKIIWIVWVNGYTNGEFPYQTSGNLSSVCIFDIIYIESLWTLTRLYSTHTNTHTVSFGNYLRFELFYVTHLIPHSTLYTLPVFKYDRFDCLRPSSLILLGISVRFLQSTRWLRCPLSLLNRSHCDTWCFLSSTFKILIVYLSCSST